MKILWMSNAPWATSAYAGQTRLHVPRLRQLGHELAIFAFYGLHGGTIQWDGIPIFPGGIDAWGNDIAGAHAAAWGADVLLANMDSWVLKPDAFPNVPLVCRFPIDMEPLSAPVKAVISRALVRIVESRYGERLVAEAGLDSVYVPACVDTTVYQPMDRAEARRLLGWPADKFIVGMVAANKGNSPSRKGFAAALGGFAEFKRSACPDALLYLHCTKGSNGEYDGEDLAALATMEGVLSATLFGDQYQLVTGGIPDQHMRALYSAFDVLLVASMGEGFCVPLVEAQACGTPAIAPDWTATGELIFGGWRLTQREPFPLPRFGSYQFIASREDVAGRLREAYAALRNPARREQLSKKARAGALEYDADHVAATYWPAALAQIEERLAALRTPINPTPEQCGACGIGGPPWAKLGWLDGKGNLLLPCMHANCANALRRDLATGRQQFVADGFPMEVDGIPLAIADTPPGSVAKIVAREATATYHLDQRTFQPGDVVVDVGAHVGVISCYLAKRWPEIRVIAVEPIPQNYARLVENVRANGLTNVTPVHTAISGDGQPLILVGDYDQNTGGVGVANAPRPGRGEIFTPSTTLRQLLDDHNVDHVALLKLDCEGAEHQALHADPEVLTRVAALVGEIHESPTLAAQGYVAADLVRLIEGYLTDVNVGICPIRE